MADTAAVTPPGIVAEAYVEDIRREAPVAVIRSVVEAPLGIPEGPDRAIARIAEQVEDMSDAAEVGPGTRGPAPHYEAVVTLLPGEVDTLAPLGGVTGLSHAADMAARREEGMARTAVVLRTCHADPHTERRGELAVALTASGQQADMQAAPRTAGKVVPGTSAEAGTRVSTGPVRVMVASGILLADIPASVMVPVGLAAVRTDLGPASVIVPVGLVAVRTDLGPV